MLTSRFIRNVFPLTLALMLLSQTFGGSSIYCNIDRVGTDDHKQWHKSFFIASNLFVVTSVANVTRNNDRENIEVNSYSAPEIITISAKGAINHRVNIVNGVIKQKGLQNGIYGAANPATLRAFRLKTLPSTNKADNHSLTSSAQSTSRNVALSVPPLASLTDTTKLPTQLTRNANSISGQPSTHIATHQKPDLSAWFNKTGSSTTPRFSTTYDTGAANNNTDSQAIDNSKALSTLPKPQTGNDSALNITDSNPDYPQQSINFESQIIAKASHQEDVAAQHHKQSQIHDNSSEQNLESAAKITVRAEKRGAPYINFQDGKELPFATQKDSSSPSPHLLASADFDADGVADLVTADSQGTLKFYRGNLDAMFPNSSQAKQHKADGTFLDSPFYPSEKSFSLGITPDFLVVGDFNADGKQDVLALAKNDNRLQLLRGDGHGNFATPQTILLAGRVTALAAGEIGKPDGQTDLAIAIQNDKSSQLVVFEHPEGAFKHKPEIITLPAPATDLAIGNLDEDFYADIAVASGNQLTVIHGRGQVYPWDLLPQLGIKRPPPVVATRTMPFVVSAMTVGRFGEKRGQSLALLGTDGNIYRLEANRKQAPSNNKLPDLAHAQMKQVPFVPTDAEPRTLATLANPELTPEMAEKLGIPMVDASLVKGGGFQEYLKNLLNKAPQDAKKLDPQSRAKIIAEGAQRKAEQQERTKAAFLRSLAAKPSTLAQWEIETLVSGSQFAGAAATVGARQLSRVNVSSSNLDDLMVTDKGGKQIQFLARIKKDGATLVPWVAAVETEGSPLAVLPMRLNLDALSDLVVLRQGASVPSIVMTVASQTFTVTSSNETGTCLGDNPCSLRNAITLANQNPGADEIVFNLGGGVHTIAPDLQLPVITDAVTITGEVNGSGQPLVEISGTHMTGSAVDGLKIRTSNTTILGLAINQFTNINDINGQIGGNGITIESTLGSPNNGNNYILGCYLGTDPTGSLAKGNASTGLLIFDADSNFVRGNLMSGNSNEGSQYGGVGLDITAGNSNTFEGNIIGINSLGTGKLGNGIGVFFTGANNIFGGDGAGAGNTVSGNGRDVQGTFRCAGEGIKMVVLIDLDTGELLTLNNTIRGNRIGTNPAGTVGSGNCHQGINTHPLTQTTIGSITHNGRNIVSDNGLGGIYCDDNETPGQSTAGGYCSIAGNNIGTDVSGNIAIPNDIRNIIATLYRFQGSVDIFNNLSFSNFGAPGGTTPNGACTGFCNLFSGNHSELGGFGFIFRMYLGTVGIFNNSIGTNQTGNQALPNEVGIGVATSFGPLYGPLFGDTFVGGVGVDDNNSPISLGNLISGNLSQAVFTNAYDDDGRGSYATTYIQGNLMGTDASGINAIANGSGAFLHGGFSDQVFVGGTDFLARNIISGNLGDGIYSNGYFTPAPIVNNLIGLNRSLNPLGNGGNGIVVNGYGTQIGGTDQEANQISNNGTNGVNFAGVLITQNASGITIRGNSINNNSGLGIDLNGGGVTENDNCNQDSDLGGNDLQNFPELFAPVFNANGTVTVEGVLRSIGQKSYKIDFYANATADPSGHGEGQTYIGLITAVSDGNGFASFTYTSTMAVSSSSVISATATDDYGNTSEFSCNAGAACNSLISRFRNLKDYLASPQDACPLALVVNLSGDQEDQNPNDGVCDIDTSNSDSHECTLRAALQIIMKPGYVGTHTIEFNIPGAGVHTITPATPLPVITQTVTINATTQSGYTNRPLIEIRGGGDSTAYFGLDIHTTGSRIFALAIRDFAQANIVLDGQGRNDIFSCFLGISADGSTAGNFPNSFYGILIQNGSSLNHIGNKFGRNVISNNATGVQIVGTNSNFNKVDGNIIGYDSAGTTPIQNYFGVIIGQGASRNDIGESGEGNLIGNSQTGVAINDSGTNLNRVSSNIISNNTIGVDLNFGSSLTIIGGSAEDTNFIAGNNVGIHIAETSSDNSISGNFIGLDHNGTPLQNFTGIQVEGDNNKIGVSGAPNIISSNLIYGIRIEQNQGSQETAQGNLIQFNRIGTNPEGTAKLGSQQSGIVVSRGAISTTILKNTISGNTINGILLNSRSTQTTIKQNLIGTNAAGNNAIPNTFGIYVADSSTNTISQNVLSGNRDIGVLLGLKIDPFSAISKTTTGATNNLGAKSASPNDVPGYVEQNRVESNLIGTSSDQTIALPNGRYGIAIGEKARNNSIGGPREQKLGNTITDHGGLSDAGIFLGTLDSSASDDDLPKQNVIAGNRIGFSETNNGQISLGPNSYGIRVENAINNYVGFPPEANPQSQYGNQICSNLVDGIFLRGSRTALNAIKGNYVGFFASIPADVEAGNQHDGIAAYGVTYNEILENRIGHNGANGIFTSGVGQGSSNTSFKISGNEIGFLQVENDPAITGGNVGRGIYIFNSSHILVGSESEEDFTNFIAANGAGGVLIEGAVSVGNGVKSSVIGTDTLHSQHVGNVGDGIEIRNAISSEILGNVIIENGGNGIFVNGFATATSIKGNDIGSTEIDGSYRVRSNFLNGIKIFETGLCTIGSTAAGDSNVISGNLGSGIVIQGGSSQNNTIKRNFIGTNPAGLNLGNEEYGILFTQQAQRNKVGGPETNGGNTIKFNGLSPPDGSGIAADTTAGCCNGYDPNIIFGNAGLGIDLGISGPTPNDPGDADSGPNNLQNFPEFASALINSSGNLILQYKVDSHPSNSNYGANGLYIEFFKADASPNLQGQSFVGSTHYTVSDYNNGTPGTATFDAGNAAALGVVVGDKIIATTTDADDNTSEFTSTNVGVVGNQPTAVKLISFSAAAYQNSVLLSWQTGMEVDNLGFHLYREVDGQRTRLTPQLIAGSALADGPGTSLLAGHTYYWADTPPVGKTVSYFLEDLDLNGKTTLAGPYLVSDAAPPNAQEAERRSILLSQLGTRQSLLANGLASQPLPRVAIPSAAASAGAIQLQADLASKPAIKIAIKQEGFYRLTQPELIRAGLDPKVDPRLLQLFVGGIEVPMKIADEQDGHFDSTSYLEFYGLGIDTPSTDTRIYWLTLGNTQGKRINQTKGEGVSSSAQSFTQTIERRDRSIYFAALRNGDKENFFGAVVVNQGVDQALNVTHLAPQTSESATLEVALQGVTLAAHRVLVQVNGVNTGYVDFREQQQGVGTFILPPSSLREGTNAVRLLSQNGASDVSLVDHIRLSYQHSYMADDNTLTFAATGNQRLTIDGFTSKAIRVFDVTDAANPQELLGDISGGKTGTQITLTPTQGGQRTLLAVTDEQLKKPIHLILNQESNWRRQANAADLVIVSPRAFFSALEPLKALRQSQGLSVTIVDIEDLYDEFNFGTKSVQAVRDFFTYAKTQWKQAPRFALLVGDGSYDPKNYLGYGDNDLLPTKLLDTNYLETASDDWLADFNNDGIADLAIGRLPVRTVEEATKVVQKIISYDRAQPSNTVLLVADRNEGFNFEQVNHQLRDLIPATLKITEINRSAAADGQPKPDLLAAINSGAKMVNYAGHGSTTNWNGNLLTVADASTLTNREQLSLFVMMNCLNGYFQEAASDSLAEALLKADGGAVAVWASSGLTMPQEQAAMDQELFRQLFSSTIRQMTLGEAVLRAKSTISNVELRRTWILIGDPSMPIKY